jgi:hypothetical protein
MRTMPDMPILLEDRSYHGAAAILSLCPTHIEEPT